MMTYLCQVWGGHAHPIIPVRGLDVPESYQRCLHGDQYDIVERPDRDQQGLGLPDRIRQERAWDYPAVFVAAHARRDLIVPVDVAVLEPGDPWAPIYAATLGVLPGQLDESLQKFVGHPQALPFEEIIPISYTQVTGSLDDLVRAPGQDRIAESPEAGKRVARDRPGA